MLHKTETISSQTVLYSKEYNTSFYLTCLLSGYYDCTSGKSSNIVDFLNDNEFICKNSRKKIFLDDGLFSEKLPKFDNFIITNPPYSKKDKFIERCYEIGKPF